MTETPHRLGEVLGSVLQALSFAQFQSDQYTAELQKFYDDPKNPLNPLGVPNAQFSEVRLSLKFAVSEVRAAAEGSASPVPPPNPEILVLVDASSLEKLPEKAISHFDFVLKVPDAEPTRMPAAQGDG